VALADDLREVLVECDVPLHGERLAEPAARRGDLAVLGRGSGARPDDDGIAGRITAGDAVAEDPLLRRLGGRCGVEEPGVGDGCRRCGQRRALQDSAAGRL